MPSARPDLNQHNHISALCRISKGAEVSDFLTRKCRTLLTAICASNTAHNYNTAILLILRRRIWVMPFRRQLAHCRRCILQSEERRQAVGLETFL